MPSYSSLSPVSAAIYATLNVASMLALAPGGIRDDAAQGTGYPFVLYEVEETPIGGIGSKPGTGNRTLEVGIRLHVYSTFQGFSQAQGVMAKAIQLLAVAPSVSGYGSWALFHDDTIPLDDEVVAGVKVKELVGFFRLYVTES
jgi:hypothetical protein